MTDVREILVVCDSSLNVTTATIYDYKTGTTLHTYKNGGTSAPNTATFIRNDYFISAEVLKPLLHVWPINSQEMVKNVRFVCPGQVRALDISSDGVFCAAGINEKVYVWQIASGKLICVTSKHLQPITKIKFTSDNSSVVTCGDDGLVIVWPLVNLTEDKNAIADCEPLYILSDHSLPVTDLFVGRGGVHSRLFTVSADRMLKIYHLRSGNLILNVIFDRCLTAVACNACELRVFVGADTGDVYELNLTSPVNEKELFVNEKANLPVFTAHTKAVTSLSVSLDGSTLVSGAKDELVIVWNVFTKQKIRVFPQKGVVTNVFFRLTPKNMFSHDFKPLVSLHAFERCKNDEDDTVVEINNPTRLFSPLSCEKPVQKYVSPKESDAESNICQLNEIVGSLKFANRSLYDLAIDKIMKSNAKSIVSHKISIKKK